MASVFAAGTSTRPAGIEIDTFLLSLRVYNLPKMEIICRCLIELRFIVDCLIVV